MSEQTPPQVAEKATIADAIDLRQLTLLGVMHAFDGPAALLRSGRGQIARVQTGGQAFGYRVAAIGDDQVQLIGRQGQLYALGLAGT
ncbi:pilus assembly protein PilZ [Yoonia sp. BS5-3]|uniref:Pilus assembly protein PilZ n=1 Tax=Yoonia phaeophyticola TaxID=3137369 RepID=A0ABZ2V2C2_9RHOB